MIAAQDVAADATLELTPSTPSTAVTRTTVTFDRAAPGDPGVLSAFGTFTTTFPIDGVQSNASWIVGHTEPHTVDVTNRGTLLLNINVDGVGNATSGNISERVDYGAGLTTLFESSQLLAFDHVSGTNQYRFAFLQDVDGTFIQDATVATVAADSIIAGVIFSGSTGPNLATDLAFSSNIGTEVKTWVALGDFTQLGQVRPQLLISLPPVPEPGIMGLVAPLALLVGRRRRV